MVKERLIEAFKEIGFDEYKEIKTNDIIFSQDVFKQCEKNTCGNFGINHACPPGAGTIDERKASVLKYENAFIISKIVSIKTRKEMMESLEIVAKVNKNLRSAFENEDIPIMGAGPCTKCKKCTALDNEPCRFPDKIEYSMEGSGIDVVRMSMNQKMTYNAGAGKIGYFTLVLYND
jgi:predicted metal-binding protein